MFLCVQAMRNNYNGFSITELLLDEAAKRDISIKKLWDTLKKLDVHGCTEIEQDWSGRYISADVSFGSFKSYISLDSL